MMNNHLMLYLKKQQEIKDLNVISDSLLKSYIEDVKKVISTWGIWGYYDLMQGVKNNKNHMNKYLENLLGIKVEYLYIKENFNGHVYRVHFTYNDVEYYIQFPTSQIDTRTWEDASINLGYKVSENNYCKIGEVEEINELMGFIDITYEVKSRIETSNQKERTHEKM